MTVQFLEFEMHTLFAVMDSWEVTRRLDQEMVGSVLFANLFELCPATKTLFGFTVDVDPRSEEVKNSPHFKSHARMMMQMLDRALNMVGPDSELLEDMLTDLGKKHARLGVQERFFPFMGQALMAALKECLGSEFTPEVEAAWEVVYHALSFHIVKAMNSEQSVLDSWAELKKMDNYEKQAGALLFQKLFRKSPETKTIFGFPKDLDMESKIILESRRFQKHSVHFIEMLNKAMGMVEANKLQDEMKSLGELHADYGVKPEFFPIMGEALYETLETLLGEAWNTELKGAWQEVYERLSSQMIAAINKANK